MFQFLHQIIVVRDGCQSLTFLSLSLFDKVMGSRRWKNNGYVDASQKIGPRSCHSPYRIFFCLWLGRGQQHKEVEVP
jgi:hypothetical protein